ncbi:unnamed protein product [Leptidea sinapis]|uniref:Uncharacterized protein n=1 Tax=Leptidea sinapis TaxID=189913 RepID=A0A5E4QHE3_9NEOP|nr:unnamed protein product [Leptidea sinapis]
MQRGRCAGSVWAGGETTDTPALLPEGFYSDAEKLCGGPPQCGFQGAFFHVLQSCGFLIRCFRDDTTWVPSKKARIPSLKAGNAPVIPLVLQLIVDGGDHLTTGDRYNRLSSYSIKKKLFASRLKHFS